MQLLCLYEYQHFPLLSYLKLRSIKYDIDVYLQAEPEVNIEILMERMKKLTEEEEEETTQEERVKRFEEEESQSAQSKCLLYIDIVSR